MEISTDMEEILAFQSTEPVPSIIYRQQNTRNSW